ATPRRRARNQDGTAQRQGPPGQGRGRGQRHRRGRGSQPQHRTERREARQRMLPATISYPPELPVVERRDDIAEVIRDHQVVLVAGETGSGKTTQLDRKSTRLNSSHVS